MTPADAVHCDDLINDKSQPDCLRRFLRFHRWPASYQFRAASLGVKRPKLFATHMGHRVRVVMASRFGDVGVTTDLDTDHGYDARVTVNKLHSFSDTP